MSKTLVRRTVLPAGADEIWEKLQSLSSLAYVAAPYAAFSPENGAGDVTWKQGETFRLIFRLFGFIPFGVHTIRIVIFDREQWLIYSNESNPRVPVWNHRIRLKPLDKARTEYTDEVEIDAGGMTGLVFLWANMFYAHRQRKWKKLLSRI